MPLWRVFSHPSTFTPAQREALSTDITSIYTRGGLPAFYVNVIFIDVPETAVYVGGKPRTNFVRFVVEHIARNFQSTEHMKGFMDRAEAKLKPYVADRGNLDWEIHVSETPRPLWRIQGLEPPPANSEAEKEWFMKDRALQWKL
ncbi:uncharacterized protein AB675_1455 [Cyphellophora attinorum]|uniref:Tautomerase cis-CaaD-like domain-containing protein n=1 Tax=Cyphellophora attinorum TaxID=1664694 RepID=A0A0N1H5U3_9EURO|nr:uncharacterized protein AB675_1455 [Phialophora attinorum]KPI37247.1 hypothetical protein AB675_1455 [Phialophora attinorum]